MRSMVEDAANALIGICVLVTRPAHQAQSLCNRIKALGGRVMRLPVIEIDDPVEVTPAIDIIRRLDNFDIAVFISGNAVEKGLALVNTYGHWPEHLKIAAVGKHTAEILQQHDIHIDIMPQQQFNSEGLLAVEDLQQLDNKQIVIFRGQGGRELLAQSLRQRGAQVEYAEVYRRIKPECDTSKVQQAGLSGAVDIAIVTSNEGLQNLYDMIGEPGRRWLLHTPLVVISQRTAELAQKLGFKSSVIAKQASDKGLADAVKEWYAIHSSAGK